MMKQPKIWAMIRLRFATTPQRCFPKQAPLFAYLHRSNSIPQTFSAKRSHLSGSGGGSGSICLHMDRISRLAKLPNLEAKQLQLELQRSIRSGDAIEVPVNAVLHSCIPSAFVDQFQSPTSLALANHAKASSLAEEVFRGRIKALPQSTTLETAKSIINLLEDSNAEQINGILVPGIGLLSFATTAQECYRQSIELDDLATRYFESLGSLSTEANPSRA